MSARAQVTSFQSARNASPLVCARGLHVASPWRVLGDRTLSVVDGFPLASTSRVRGHCDLLTFRGLSGFSVPGLPEGSRLFSLLNRVRQHSKNNVLNFFQGAVPPDSYFFQEGTTECGSSRTENGKSGAVL